MRFSLKSLSTARHSKTTRLQRGFTLIELVIVLAVLGALAAIAVPQLTGLQEEADLAGTAAVVSSEVSNVFAQELADGNVSETFDSSSGVCGAINGISDADTVPALSGYSLSGTDENTDGVIVTVPTYVSNQVESVECELTVGSSE